MKQLQKEGERRESNSCFSPFSMDTGCEYVFIHYLCLFCFCMVITHAANNKVRVRRCGSERRKRKHLELVGPTATYEVESAALRGMGKSLEPSILTILGTVVFRIIWLATVFRLIPTYDMLMNMYVASWIFTGICNLSCMCII